MPQLIAEMDFTYDHRSLKVGDRFEATDKHAFILKHGRRARDAEPDAPASKRAPRYHRRDMTAED